MSYEMFKAEQRLRTSTNN